MSQTTQQTMKCAACGLKYPWSAQMAGRKIKCKCGTIFVAPREAGGPAAPAVGAVVATLGAPAGSTTGVAPAQPAPPIMARATAPGRVSATVSAAPAHAPSAPRATAPVTPSAVASARPMEANPIIDLDDGMGDDLTTGMYDIAEDLDAPPPLAAPPMPAQAISAPKVAGKGSGSPRGAKVGKTAPAFPGYGIKRMDDSAEKKSEIKRLLIPAAGVLVLVGIVIGLRYANVGAKTDYSKLPAGDGRFQRIADEDGAFEAKKWLTDNDQRGVIGFSWTRNKTEAKIDTWYKDGAKNVFAFGQGVFTASLAIELPDPGAKRKAFFDWAETKRKAENPMAPPIVDIGQKFMFIDSFD